VRREKRRPSRKLFSASRQREFTPPEFARECARGKKFACSAEKNRIRFSGTRSTRCSKAARDVLANPASEKKIKHGC
jgi:hypothetical protein